MGLALRCTSTPKHWVSAKKVIERKSFRSPGIKFSIKSWHILTYSRWPSHFLSKNVCLIPFKFMIVLESCKLYFDSFFSKDTASYPLFLLLMTTDWMAMHFDLKYFLWRKMKALGTFSRNACRMEQLEAKGFPSSAPVTMLPSYIFSSFIMWPGCSVNVQQRTSKCP